MVFFWFAQDGWCILLVLLSFNNEKKIHVELKYLLFTAAPYYWGWQRKKLQTQQEENTNLFLNLTISSPQFVLQVKERLCLQRP